MKKKAIEKIPYLGLQRTIKKKGLKYIGVTSVERIAAEEHLIVEIYGNREKSKQVPVARIVLNEKDFGTYLPKTGEWKGRKVKDERYPYTLIWQKETNGLKEWEKENALQSQEDKERIENWCKKKSICMADQWWTMINDTERKIESERRRKKECRRYEKRQQALKERKDNTGQLPEKRILEYADTNIFRHKHFLYYKKRGSWVHIACSKCGGTTDARWKPGQSYESEFQKRTQEPRDGILGQCPLCSAYGTYKPQGKAKGAYTEKRYLFLGEKYKEKGFVLRYVQVEKRWELEELMGEKGLEMYGSREVLEGVEIARVYFEDGKKLQKDYQKYDQYTGQNFWDDCNLCGMQNITIGTAPIMPETWENIKGTSLQYSCMREYREKMGCDINPVDYLQRYLEFPQIEMLVKMGLVFTADKIVKCECGIVANSKAKRPDLFLGIRNDKVRLLRKEKGDTKVLQILKMEKRLGENWTEQQIYRLMETGIRENELKMALEHMSVQQILNRVEKYSGCGYGTQCQAAEARLRHAAQEYMDYLKMRQDLGYNLENTVYQQPKDLGAAHEKMVHEINKSEQDKRLKEVAEKYPMIRKNYRKLWKRYFYEDETFEIRPARSAEEIVLEGRILHHCVGGNRYLEKHNDGITYILLLRFREDKRMPYITVELQPEKMEIIQWYGAHDRKPDKENMQRWLDAYVTRLKCRLMEGGEEAGEEAGQQALQVLAYA